jgi:maleylpyruvate isomerase
MRPVAHINACHTSHRRLLDDLRPLTDADLRSPSLLPGYSRGHLVTHLTNKARAHVARFDAAAEPDFRRMWAHGRRV